MKKSKTYWKAAFFGALVVLGLAFFAPSAHAADATDTKTVAKERLEKNAVCTKCHDESENKPILSLYQTRHGAIGDPRTPACMDCHGPSANHLKGNVDGKGRPAPDRVFGRKSSSTAHYAPTEQSEQSELCLTCHKSGARMYWPGSQHDSNDVACTSCHTIHNPVDKVRVKAEQPEVCFQCHKDQRALIKKISAHPIDVGKMACSDCHNPHGSAGEHLMKQNTVNETCFLCHADKRGPFLWEHQPVTEDCTACHNPHGSNLTPLLKTRTPFLCQNCHNGPHDSSVMYGANTAGRQATGVAPLDHATGRACLQCHIMVHGSNSPAGQALTR